MHVTELKKLTIWGNHSATQYPDIFHAEVAGKNASLRTSLTRSAIGCSRPNGPARLGP